MMQIGHTIAFSDGVAFDGQKGDKKLENSLNLLHSYDVVSVHETVNRSHSLSIRRLNREYEK